MQRVAELRTFHFGTFHSTVLPELDSVGPTTRCDDVASAGPADEPRGTS